MTLVSLHLQLIAEAVRVLAPGGLLEVMETDWTFYGTPKRIARRELEEIENGRHHEGPIAGPRIPPSRSDHANRNKQAAEGPSEYDAIQIVFERMMHRR